MKESYIIHVHDMTSTLNFMKPSFKFSCFPNKKDIKTYVSNQNLFSVTNAMIKQLQIDWITKDKLLFLLQNYHRLRIEGQHFFLHSLCIIKK